MAPPELGPCRSELWIEVQAALVQLTSRGEALIRAGQFVPSQVELVGPRVLRRIRGRRCESWPGTWQRERLDHAPGDIVLQAEQVAERRLDRVRSQQRSARCLDQLHRHTQLFA